MAKVLVIENDRDILAEYEKVLIEDGCKVIKAYDGHEGLQKFHNDKFDLVIANFQLPKISGKKLIQQLQGPSFRMLCPLLISYVESDSVQKDFISGITATDNKIQTLTHPIDKQTLLSRVHAITKKQTDLPGKMDVRFVNPVLQATVNVLKEVTSFTINVGRPFLKNQQEPSGDISGVVTVKSTGFKGIMSLSFSEAGYLKIVSGMLGEPYNQITNENKDAVAELLNMIFGQAKKALNDSGMDIQSAIPTVISGSQHFIPQHAHHPTIVIPFSSPEIGDFRSEVSSLS